MDYNAMLEQIIQKTLGGVDATVSFLSSEIPQVIQQLLWWKFSESLVLNLSGLLLLVLFVLADKKLYHIAKSSMNSEDIVIFWGVFGSLIRGIFVTVLIDKVFSLTWLQILLAPKIYLLQYAATLLK